MASKKDRLIKKIKEEVKKNISSKESKSKKTSLQEVIGEIQQNHSPQSREKGSYNTLSKKEFHPSKKIQKNQDKSEVLKNTENMSTRRDSIYNVSADLRLEDYVEDNQKREYGPILRYGLIFLLILLIIAGIWKAYFIIFAPKFYLSIASSEITDSNYQSFLEDQKITLLPGQMIHIRFTWLEPISEYYTILILKQIGENTQEEAILGRKIPKTANYIYFAGPLDTGTYIIQVFDQNKHILIERKIEIIGQ